MSRSPSALVIDARPRGPHGPFAGERVQGRTVLDHLLDLAAGLAEENAPVTIHARADEHVRVGAWAGSRPFVLAAGPPPEGSAVLRTDRLYDAARLRKALRRGKDPETAVLWRLDRPHALAGADDELTRRQTYQPLGRFWALTPARALARALAPTRVRPNAVTLASALMILGASAVVARGGPGWAASALIALGIVLDTADGHLARLQGTGSSFGQWLDGWLDEVGDMALHAAVAWSAFVSTARPLWLMVGILYAAGKYLFVAATTEPGGASSAPPALVTGRRPSGLQALVRLAGHADIRLHLWVALAAIGRLDLALGAYAAYFPARAALVAVRKGVRGG